MNTFQEKKEEQLTEQEKMTTKKPEKDLSTESSAEVQDPYAIRNSQTLRLPK